MRSFISVVAFIGLCTTVVSGQSLPSIDFRFQFLAQHGLNKSGSVEQIPATIRFRLSPTPEVLDEIERLGVHFLMRDGRRMGTTTVYPVQLSLSNLSRLGAIPEILSIQPSWHPAHVPPLDISRIAGGVKPSHAGLQPDRLESPRVA